MKDSYDRKINYLRLSVTDRCNLRCKYCMPESGISKKTHQDILRHEEMLRIVRISAKLGIEKVRLTGGEPLIRKGIVDLVREIKCIDGIRELTMTTNGILLGDMLDDLVEAGLDRINLSLDTLDENKYRKITRGGELGPVLDCMKRILDKKMKLKINVVLIGGFNIDEVVDFVNLTKDHPIDVRFIELMPIGEASQWSHDKFVSGEKVLELAKLLPVVTEDLGSPAKYYKLEDGLGRVGLINPISCSFCDNCNRIRVTSDGKVKPCLHSDSEIDLMNIIRNQGDLEEALKEAIWKKPKAHGMNDEDYMPIKRDMNRIGG
ncbi:GTP 3',8-cyclase MoaA [Acidaminobacter sp. JC074]|uniref:GTP 3',8-cyclase MoaA n=1 Tax=Acidaminobacter sp. JC074 TaxID=2530199 RepID=UPI001F0FBC6E|nr:GTP 3',8-cyclase MoaA [Acidaminobacter sp. JC074]MCH4888990.1 GTP 3',8-cyclase MoaA [Acidaminobacter sp. JC074]